MLCPQISQRKLLQIATKPQNLQKFFFSWQLSHYMVVEWLSSTLPRPQAHFLFPCAERGNEPGDEACSTHAYTMVSSMSLVWDLPVCVLYVCRLVVDEWLELKFPDSERGQSVLSAVQTLRSTWTHLLEMKLQPSQSWYQYWCSRRLRCRSICYIGVGSNFIFGGSRT